MRIVFVNPVGAMGGAELFLLEMLSQLRERCPEWELHLILGATGSFQQNAEACGVKVHMLPLPDQLAMMGDSSVHSAQLSTTRRLFALGWRLMCSFPPIIRYASRFRRLLRQIGPDLVHSNGMKFHVITGLVCSKNVPLIWFMHDYLSSRALMRRILPLLSGPVALVHANSISVANDVRNSLPGKTTDVLYCGIDLHRFSPGKGIPERLDELSGLAVQPSVTLRVGLIATFARWKGQDIFLEAAAAVAARTPSIRFFIVGGPIYASPGSQFTLDELQGRAVELGIHKSVGFIPFQTDTTWVYRSLDVVVHASRQPEPFGRTILEAMACGRPVIATHAGGAAEIFEQNLSAIGVLPGSVEHLTEAILRLAEDADLRTQLSIAAQTRAQRFSRQQMGEELEQSIQNVLPSSGTPSCRMSSGMD